MPIRVCFVGLNTYPLFNPTARHIYGGAEVRSVLFSLGLARDPEFDMNYVVRDDGQPRQESFHNINVFAHPGYVTTPSLSLAERLFSELTHAGGLLEHTRQFPYRRIVNYSPRVLAKYGAAQILKVIDRLTRWPTWASFPRLRIHNYIVPRSRYSIYDSVDADIYAVFGVSNLAGEVAAFCGARGKKFVLFLADMINLDERYKPDARGVDVYESSLAVCHYAIEQADLIVAQLESQQQLLTERFGRSAAIVRNPVELSTTATRKPDAPLEQRCALWIGRADNFKKMPMLLIELARACPDVPFIMVMNSHMPQVEQAVYAARPSNVIIYERLPIMEIEKLFEEAFVFVSTAAHEGFPNTFLQAGKHGVPVLSHQVDPDGFLEKYECGIVARGQFEALVSGLRTLQNDTSGRFSENIRRYVQLNHELNARVCEVAALFRALHADRPAVLRPG